MPDLNSAERKDIKVAGIMLTGYLPYSDGHPCNANEANALNQTYLENLRNNFAPSVKKACEVAGVDDSSKLTTEQLKDLQSKFEGYCESYEFGVRGTREGNPVKSRAVAIATEKVKEAIRANGLKISEVGAEKIREKALEAVEANPAFMAKAEALIAAEREAAAGLTIEL